jgi:hypothetical protein
VIRALGAHGRKRSYRFFRDPIFRRSANGSYSSLLRKDQNNPALDPKPPLFSLRGVNDEVRISDYAGRMRQREFDLDFVTSFCGESGGNIAPDLLPSFVPCQVERGQRRYGDRAWAQYRPHFAYSGQLELIVWSIPILAILFLGGVIWIGSHELDPANPIASPNKPLKVQAVSLDWKWLFIYPDQGIPSVNELVMPVGVPVHFSLTSSSVMNNFFVPQLGSMIATMNGMVTQLHLKADHPGDYLGLSAHNSAAMGFQG